MPVLQAVVFDFDGTILDTETPDYQTWQKVYRRYGVDLPLEVWLQCVGGGTGEFEPGDYLESLIGRPLDRRRLRAERREQYMARVAEQSVLPGVTELLAEAERRKLKLAVASSSDREWVENHLQRLTLRGHFAVVVTADDVERVKPDPALYRLAAERLGAAPARTLAIEDSYNGMLGAQRAGLRCVSVPNRVTRSSDFSAADLCLDSISSLSPQALLDYFDRLPARSRSVEGGGAIGPPGPSG